MRLDEKLNFFAEQISCGENYYLWHYNSKGILIKSNCPSEKLFDETFTIFGCKDDMVHHKNIDRPIMLSSPIGITWMADCERSGGEIKQYIVLGPIFPVNVSAKWLNNILSALGKTLKKKNEVRWQLDMQSALREIPVGNSCIMNQYALMLHYILTGERITVNELRYAEPKILDLTTEELTVEQLKTENRKKVWDIEQEMINVIREGKLHHSFAANPASIGGMLLIHNDDPLRQPKDSLIVFISMCARAAVEGGLSIDVAYTLADHYIEQVETARTTQEIISLNMRMYDDLRYRVYRCQNTLHYSTPVRQCCDYIAQHLEDKISTAKIAQDLNYSVSYLCHKFKEETGQSLIRFLQKEKVDYAKQLLRVTEDSVTEIAERLKFCSDSYFCKVFSACAGCSPAEYRRKCECR